MNSRCEIFVVWAARIPPHEKNIPGEPLRLTVIGPSVCRSVVLSIHPCVRVFMSVHVRMFVFVYARVYVCVRACHPWATNITLLDPRNSGIRLCVCVCVRACVRACMPVYLRAGAHICARECTYICALENVCIILFSIIC